MKIVKNINNNYALAVDDDGSQLIVTGNGIGFGKIPRVLDDMSKIDRTYYNVEESYISMIREFPEDVMDVANHIVDKTRLVLSVPINSNLVFTLADHINFSVQRKRQNIRLSSAVAYDVQALYEKEYAIGEYGLNLIHQRLGVYLSDEEAAFIAMHIITAEQEINKSGLMDEKIIQAIVKIIERNFNTTIDLNSYNFSRFVTHMQYLFVRGRKKSLIASVNSSMYEELEETYPLAQQCVEEITPVIDSYLMIKLSEEEKMYLLLHINRMVSREEQH